MTAAAPVDVKVNPNDSTQRYILWGNGRIDNLGGAPAITGQATWFTRVDQPVAVGLWITDWAAGAGYILDMAGGCHEFGGAPDINSGILDGVPYVSPKRKYVDWSWDPAGSGHGIVLDQYGQIYAFGGAALPSRSGPRWSWPAARRLKVSWSAGQPSKAITLDLYGGLHGDYGLASAMTPGGYWPGWDAARDLAVMDWTTTPPKTQTLDLYGALHPGGGATRVFGFPYRKGADVARRVAALSTADPASFLEVWASGQQFEWASSTAPTVLAGGDAGSPAATVTDTTRPTLAWSYSDPEADSQAAWELYVFTEAFAAGRSMTDPSAWASSALAHLTGVDPAQRGAVADYDFVNGSYRFYVRAQDTSGLWSAWAHLGWTQNVPAPATPTGLTAVADPATLAVALSVSAAVGGSADSVAFDCSDDGGVTWGLVRGAEAVPIVGAEQRRNLISNPSLEGGSVAGWNPNMPGGAATATVQSSGGLAGTGSHFYRLTVTTGTSSAAGAYFSSAPVIPGTVYTASGYVRSSIAQTMHVGIDWYDSNGVYLSTNSGAGTSTPANTVTRLSGTATAPAGAVKAVLTLYSTGVTAWTVGATLDVDAALLEAAGSLGAYFDGDTADTGTVVYEWDGTPYASQSVALATPGTVTATDWDIPLGVTRTYRAVAYNDSPRVVSNPSDTVTASITTLVYALTAVDDATLGGIMPVQEPVEWTRPVSVGIFDGVGAEFATVVSDGTPRSRRFTVHLLTQDAETLAAVEALGSSGSTLVYRDPYGAVVYCRLAGDWAQALMEGAGLRSLNTTDLPLVEIAPPTVLPVASTVPPGPAGS